MRESLLPAVGMKDKKGTVGGECWPLHEIVITNIVWCLACKRDVEGGSYLAQKSCNTIATVWALQVGGGMK